MKSHRSVCLAMFNLLLFSSLIFSQDTTRAIEEYLTNMEKAGRLNGSVLVAEKESVLYKKGFGYANIEHQIQNQPDSKFNIGSISKQFTTVLAYQLIDEGLLKLDGTLADYLPDYRAETGRIVTIDHLLQHTSGIPCYLRDYKRQAGDDYLFPFPEGAHFRREQFIDKYLSGDLQFAPGSRYRYSNTNFFLLYVIIEKVTGKSLEQNLNERIFDRLGMKNSGLLDDYKIIEHRASGYMRSPVGYLHSKYIYAPNTYGAGSVFSTVEDLFLWNQALNTDKVLPKKWREKMFTPYRNEGPMVKHAYSIDYYTMREPGSEPVEYTSFNGALPGYISDAIIFPKTQTTVIILDNAGEHNHNRMAFDLLSILRGEPVEALKPPAADVVGKTAVKEGISRAVETYGELKNRHKDEYDFESIEDILGYQGYLLADAGMMDDALTIFKLIVEMNPNSRKAYNDLGKIYQRIGKTDLSNDASKKGKDLEKRNQELYSYLKNGEYEKTKAIVEKIQRETPCDALLASSEIGPLFEEKLTSKKNEEAIQICRLWALANPGEVGPYFSLARVYQQKGDKEEAMKCYEKILQIAPAGRYAPIAKMRMKELKKSD